MVGFVIDGRAVAVEDGQTVLDAARRLGVDIPTLCYLEQCGPATSCLVCLVRIESPGAPRLAPACATRAVPGMVINSETEEVRAARRTALELLLSDHVGDCLAPCNRLCPLGLNIPVMLRQVQSGQLEQAVVTVRSALPLAAILGRLCHHPCEGGCRRGAWDQAAAIRDVERFVADRHVNSEELYVPPRQPETGESVAIVGAGPSGLAAAYFLLREGHACTVFDRNTMAGGSLRQAVQQGLLPADALEAETRFLQQLGMSFQAGVEVGRAVLLDDLRRDYDAVLLSLGELTKGEAETLGLAATKSGIQTDSGTGLTCLERVFAAGSAVRPVKQLVRAMNEGRLVAGAIHRLLSGQPVLLPQKQFSSVMGRLEKPELELLTAVAPAIGRVSPASGAAAGLAFGEARTEASRCLHCDCRAAGNCALQYYAARYEAEPNRFRHQRRQFDQDLRHGHVIFEPGKCILCGICVRLAELAREPLGLTFIGRGFEVRIGAPLDHTIAEGLQKAAEECVKHCPTGALAFRDFVVPSLPPLPAAAGKGPAAAPPAP